jgi:hypothetical protein
MSKQIWSLSPVPTRGLSRMTFLSSISSVGCRFGCLGGSTSLDIRWTTKDNILVVWTTGWKWEGNPVQKLSRVCAKTWFQVQQYLDGIVSPALKAQKQLLRKIGWTNQDRRRWPDRAHGVDHLTSTSVRIGQIFVELAWWMVGLMEFSHVSLVVNRIIGVQKQWQLKCWKVLIGILGPSRLICLSGSGTYVCHCECTESLQESIKLTAGAVQL